MKILSNFYKFILILSLLSCSNNDKDAGNGEYNLSPQVFLDLKTTDENKEKLETISAWVHNASLKDAKLTNDSRQVSIKNEISNLFMPINNPCASILPKKLKGKIDSVSYIPAELSTLLKKPTWPEYVKMYDGSSLSSILHTFHIKYRGLEESHSIVSPTRDAFKREDYMIDDNSSFIFTTDCSGYINVVASAALKKSLTSEFKTSLSSAITQEGSVVIGLAKFKSPLMMAVYPKEAAHDAQSTMPDSTRLFILERIFARLNPLPDTTSIEFYEDYELLFTSKNLNSRFNGKADLTLKGGVNAGIIAFKGGVDAGISVSRSTIFNDYNVMIVGVKEFSKFEKITKKLIKLKIDEIKKTVSSPKKALKTKEIK